MFDCHGVIRIVISIPGKKTLNSEHWEVHKINLYPLSANKWLHIVILYSCYIWY